MQALHHIQEIAHCIRDDVTPEIIDKSHSAEKLHNFSTCRFKHYRSRLNSIVDHTPMLS